MFEMRNQETPLHVACKNGKLDVSRFLIDHGSDINSRDEDGNIPLHLRQYLDMLPLQNCW
jgi:ankyrin repeat protein